MIEETNDRDIPLALLLEDAAVELERVNMHGLARSVRVASLLLGEADEGEAWVRDIVEVVAAAEAVVEAESSDELERPMAELAEAVESCRNWGLTLDGRLRNALAGMVLALENIRALAEQAATLEWDPATAKNHFRGIAGLSRKLVDRLGVEQNRPSAAPTLPAAPDEAVEE